MTIQASSSDMRASTVHVLLYIAPRVITQMRLSVTLYVKSCLYEYMRATVGARVDVQDKQGNTALHIAARHGHASVTKTLASNGANLLKRGAGGMLPIHMACLSGYSDCAENLIPKGNLYVIVICENGPLGAENHF